MSRMFGMSLGELIIIGVVALLVLGPERLPKVASKMGKIVGDLRKTSDGFRKELYNAVYPPADELKVLEKNIRNLVAADPHVHHPKKADESAAEKDRSQS